MQLSEPTTVPKLKDAQRPIAMNVLSDGMLSLDSCCPLRLRGKPSMHSDPISPFCTFFFDIKRKDGFRPQFHSIRIVGTLNRAIPNSKTEVQKSEPALIGQVLIHL